MIPIQLPLNMGNNSATETQRHGVKNKNVQKK